jgi:hypothetical protein
VLEFNRESVKFAEDRGFKISEVGDFPITKIPEFFFYAFRMHHKNVPRSKTDEILVEQLGGLTQKALTRLVELYTAPFDCMIADEDEVKNAKMEIEL